MNTRASTSKNKLALPGSDAITEAAARKCAELKECQDLLSARLNQPLLCMFQKLTGLRLHVLWHDPLESLRLHPTLVLCPAAIHRCKQCRHIPAVCQDCLHRHWNPAAQTAGPDRAFTGQCGATNFWASLRIGDARPLTLVLQTLPADAPARSPVAQPAPSALSQRSKPAPAPLLPRAVPFSGAVLLLRSLLHDLETTVQASLLRRELEVARLQLKNLEAEDARLRKELRQRAPGIPDSRKPPGDGNHSEQIVQRMLEYVHTNYHRPLQLGDVADALKMNACYLSSLFSHTLGVPFHYYLNKIRLAKAQELLRDPVCRVCEAACAVGYAGAESFRSSFKTEIGMSPSTWRSRHAGNEESGRA
jgi:AraC-like DNA-binding protein